MLYRGQAAGGYVHPRPSTSKPETIQDGLDASGFDWSQPTLFSWLGVTQYLTMDAVRATLRTVASCAAGSEIVLTYIPTMTYLDALGQECIETLSRVAAERDEPLQALLAPTDAEALVEQECGLRVDGHLTRDNLHRRYFAGRSDGLTPPPPSASSPQPYRPDPAAARCGLSRAGAVEACA